VNFVREALSVIFANRIRSALTATGLIIGVATVITIQVLGSGMSGSIAGALGNMTSDSFLVAPNGTQSDALKAMITRSDLTALSALPNVKLAMPMVAQSDLVSYGHHQARYFVSGDPVEPFNDLPLQYGRRFTQDEVNAAASVVILSDIAYKKLFPEGGDPVGDRIDVGLHRYVIVGVLSPPRRGLLTMNFGGAVVIPYTAVMRNYVRGERIGAARILVNDPGQLPQTEADVIRKLRDLRSDPNLEYNTFDKAQLSKGVNGIFGAMTIVVAVIGAVSLLVAGIGIMNILLVSVTERTREIGVRKAIGATRSQILTQFFIEALVLCGIGCGIGLAIGLALGWAVTNFAIVKLTGYAAPIPWIQAIVTTVAFVTVVTLAFGTYPAYRAAALDPIEALRYE
jgi:ABC-type antimicrobial peptide transport system permease subunit